MLKAETPAYVAAIVLALASPATAFDMRDCPLDRLTLIDPWGGDEFQVQRSGARPYFICGEDQQKVDGAPADTSGCRGPFGQTVLEGKLRTSQGGQDAWAVYHLHFGAAPCCGWTLQGPEDDPDLTAGMTWHAPGEVPVLRDFPFASIEEAAGTLGNVNPMIALVCREFGS